MSEFLPLIVLIGFVASAAIVVAPARWAARVAVVSAVSVLALCVSALPAVSNNEILQASFWSVPSRASPAGYGSMGCR